MAESCQVLFGQDFGRSHDTCLIAVAYGQQHRHQSDDSLSATHVTLYQAVHLMAALHILMYLAYHTFLRFGKLEWQMIVVEVIETGSYMTEYMSLDSPLTETRISHYCQLDIEQLLELQPVACP